MADRRDDLETLSRLLLDLHVEAAGDGVLRDEISHVRSHVHDLLEDIEETKTEGQA